MSSENNLQNLTLYYSGCSNRDYHGAAKTVVFADSTDSIILPISALTDADDVVMTSLLLDNAEALALASALENQVQKNRKIQEEFEAKEKGKNSNQTTFPFIPEITQPIHLNQRNK